MTGNAMTGFWDNKAGEQRPACSAWRCSIILLVSAAVRDALGEAGGDAVSLGEVPIRGYDQPMTVWQLG
jgi:hypothetical protein